MSIGSNNWEGLTLGNGRYKITAKLGEGGMGFVYRAQDQNIEADVVIKVPRQAMLDDPEFVARFTRETRSLVQLSHPHIVKVTDVGTWDGIPFAVMQFLPGGSLEDQRPTGADGLPLPCDPKKVAGWLSAVAGALDYIHGQGYVHRDVKPANILFDAVGHAFLSDFGVAKVLASSNITRGPQTAMTGAGIVLGTPEYMAPELIMGEPFDGRVDQYALAVTVYELLCGRRPFEDSTMTKVLVLHTSKAAPRLTDWCPTLPERLSQAVLKGLAKSPHERYAHCVAMAKAVEAAAEGTAARDERVRLKCPGCGKTGSIPAADFAKLKQARGRATCPACKSPIDVSSADVTATTRSTPGGTMQFSFTGNPGEYSPQNAERPPSRATAAQAIPVAQPPRHTPIAARGGTMAISPSGTQPAVSEPPLTSSQSTLGSVMEHVALPPDGKNTDVFQSLDLSGPDRLAPPPPARPVPSSMPALSKTQFLIAGGVGAAALVVVILVVSWFALSPGAKPNPRAEIAKAGLEKPGEDDRRDSQPKPPKPSDLEKSKDQLVKTTRDRDEKPIPPPINPDEKKNQTLVKLDNGEGEHRVTPKEEKDLPKPSPQPPRPTGVFANHKFDVARLSNRPTHGKYPVGKIIASPGSYGDEVMVPSGMYGLSRSKSDNPSGPRKFRITEWRVKQSGNKFVREHGGSSDMELEPRLAANLDGLQKELWEDKLAILTMWITSSRECAIVRVEILQKFELRKKSGFLGGQADIDYWTRIVTPDQTHDVDKADDAPWQEVGRMNRFYQHYKNLVNMMRKNVQTKEMLNQTAFMNRAYGDMMKGAAAEAAAQRGLQQRLTGPGR
jgi:serine/threonine protein kinase